MCRLVSIVPHQWQFSCSALIKFLMWSVSLDPSQPIRNLNIYLISSTLYLFNLKYAYVQARYLLSPNSQNNFKVGNSLFILVRYSAFLTISKLICFLTSCCHFFDRFRIMFLHIQSLLCWLLVTVFSISCCLSVYSYRLSENFIVKGVFW